MAIDGPSGAYDDDPEQAGDSKPEKGRGRSGHDVSSPVDTQPAEVRSRAEYYEELRAADNQMASADRAEFAVGLARASDDLPVL